MLVDTIVAPRVIRPLRISEIAQSVDEREALKSNPNGIGKICASFYDNRDISRAGDVESKLIALNAEARSAGLNERIPKEGFTTGKGRTPAGRVGQIIDHWVVVVSEHSRVSRGRIAHEIDTGQVDAAIERFRAEAAYTIWNREVGQAAIGERKQPNIRNAAGNRDASPELLT